MKGSISMRAADGVVKAMDMSSISKSQVSRLCEEIDKVKAFLNRHRRRLVICGSKPPYLKMRIVSVVIIIIAVGVNTDGRREVLAMEIGTSKAEPIWTEFLRELTPCVA